MRALTIPIAQDGDITVLATARPGPEAMVFARQNWGKSVRLVIATRADIQKAVQDAFSDRFSHAAVYDLAEQDPTMSAQTVFTPAQVIIAWALSEQRRSCGGAGQVS